MEKARPKNYSKEFKLMVVQEAMLPYNEGMEHVVAKKYGLQSWTVARWKELYLEHGEKGLSRYFNSGKKKTKREIELEKENAALKEEVEILKKAAAFLAAVKRE